MELRFSPQKIILQVNIVNSISPKVKQNYTKIIPMCMSANGKSGPLLSLAVCSRGVVPLPQGNRQVPPLTVRRAPEEELEGGRTQRRFLSIGDISPHTSQPHLQFDCRGAIPSYVLQPSVLITCLRTCTGCINGYF